MKKIAAYTLISLQVILVLVLVVLYERFEENADEIKVKTTIEYVFMEGEQLVGDIYVDYHINQIDKEKAEAIPDLKYNRPVYVTLVENEAGYYDVKTISEKKVRPTQPDEIVLRANYHFKDEHGVAHVRYGFEYIEDIEQYGSFQEKDNLSVTILVGKWGQQKITSIEKRTE